MYGFDIHERTKHGLGVGAIIHDIMVCGHYCKSNNLEMVFTEEGYNAPWLDGSKDGNVTLRYHDLFKPIKIVPSSSLVGVWPKCAPSAGFTGDVPDGQDSYEWYSNILKDLFVLTPETSKIIEDRILRSGFNADTDVIVHIRRTDKINKREGSQVESDEIPLSYYLDPAIKYITNSCDNLRVFLCTCDMAIVDECREYLAKEGLSMAYDQSQDKREIQSLRMAGKLTVEETIDENYMTLAIITMMSRARYLIGGRMSYLFRIGELLRYPLSSLNIKDNDKLGKAIYARDDEQIVRPMLLRRFHEFIAPSPMIPSYSDRMIVSNFISPVHFNEMKTLISSYNVAWWERAIHPGYDKVNPVHYNSGDHRILGNEAHARELSHQEWFTYMFWKANVGHGKHHDSCWCFGCRLDDTFKSYEVIDFLSKLVGKKVISYGEKFASRYLKGDYLGIHHDHHKGDYAFVLGLTEKWNPTFGGITHFLAPDKTTIIDSVIPSFGTLLVFKVDPNGETHHFVTEVTAPFERIAYTGWFNVAK